MADEKILDRIKKMLALAGSSNQGEAEAAMGKVMEFLTRHNLTLQEVEKHKTDPKEYRNVGFQEDSEYCFDARWYAEHIVKRYFHVKTARRGGTVYFLGTESNIEIATYVYGFIYQVFDLLWQIYEVKERPRAKNAKESYIRGLFYGLSDALYSEQTKVQTEMGLVLVKDDALDEFLYSQFPELRPDPNAQKPKIRKNAAAPKWNEKAMAAGISKGKEIRISKGVKGGEAGNNTLLN